MKLIKTIIIAGLIAAPVAAHKLNGSTHRVHSGHSLDQNGKGPDGLRITVRPSPFGESDYHQRSGR